MQVTRTMLTTRHYFVFMTYYRILINNTTKKRGVQLPPPANPTNLGHGEHDRKFQLKNSIESKKTYINNFLIGVHSLSKVTMTFHTHNIIGVYYPWIKTTSVQ